MHKSNGLLEIYLKMRLPCSQINSITDNTPPKNKIIYPVKVLFSSSEQGKIIWTSSDNTTVASQNILFIK